MTTDVLDRPNDASLTDNAFEKAQMLDDLLEHRRSVRVYDPEIPVDHAVICRSLERAVLAPNSSNLQLWEFYHVTSEDKKQELKRLCLNQNAAKTAQELVVFVTRRDKYKERAQFVLSELQKQDDGSHPNGMKLAKTYYGRLIPFLYFHDPLDIAGFFKRLMTWGRGFLKPTPRVGDRATTRIVAHKSLALAAQTFMLSISAEGYDTCPMEGFDGARVKRFTRAPSRGRNLNDCFGWQTKTRRCLWFTHSCSQ